MLASEKLIQAFNQQIGNEMGASMQYIAIASYFDSETLSELAKFFYQQSEEERMHAMKFVKFINDVGGKVSIPALPAPQTDFDSAEDAVAKALSWEEEVTRQIYDLVEVAKEDRNYVGVRFLDWFVEEAMTMRGIAGARLTGAGWGGCAIAIGPRDALEEAAPLLATATEVATDPFGDAAATVQVMYLVSGHLWGVGAIFFGLWLIPMGLCVHRSGWMPRLLGWILIAGGVFLLWKATGEIHGLMEGEADEEGRPVAATFGAILAQIAVIDLVFSLDSIITAVGMVNEIPVMVAAVVAAVLLMMVAAGPIGRFVSRHPTVKMLALSFLVMIGMALVADGLDFHVPKGYIYFAMAFSVAVEMLNLRMRAKTVLTGRRKPPASRG